MQLGYLILALRLQLDYGKLPPKPQDEDSLFWHYMLFYWKEVGACCVDELEAWTEEQIEYYRDYGNYNLDVHL